MKSGFFRKLMTYVVLALVFNLAIVSIAYTFTSRSVFADMKAKELNPRAQFISSLVSQYWQGDLTANTFERIIGSDDSIWDARVYIYNEKAELSIRIKPEGAQDREETELLLQSHCDQVLAGQSITTVSNQDGVGIIIGVPVAGYDGSTIGAVFMTKPLVEVNAAMSGLTRALLISFAAAMIIMVFPLYMISKSLSNPINQMTKAAQAMAAGDFSVRAELKGGDEMAKLGQSLNFLSDSLSLTIESLKLERNRLKNVLDGLNEGIIAVDAVGHVIQYNPAAIRLLGGKEQSSLEELEPFLRIWPNIGAVTQQGDPYKGELQVGEILLGVSITPLLDDAGKTNGTVTLLRDITEAERLEQTRRDYVANVSHELRTPIASIRGLADALNDGMVRKEEDKYRYYGYIVKESMRLSRLINDLLELSRLQSSKVALQKKMLDITPVVCDVADSFVHIMEDQGLDFTLNVLPENPPVYSNADRVEQILVALLSNAAKYTQANGKVVLSMQTGEEELWVAVRNTGHIREESLPHVFERFYKVDDAAHSADGTGLGLAIVDEVVRLMGERIWVENDGDDVVFTFTLQIAREQES